ncbi:MAG: hypothetical protein KGI51_09460 [Rhodospirillales bacterium]|nr:hypothetical protein [Rhodospirillales bacterium]
MTMRDDEAALLRRLAGIMIPPDPGRGMPGADDAAIMADILASIGRDGAAVRAALAALAALGFAADRDERIALDYLHAGSEAASVLGRVVLQCYYRDGRVLEALGHPARAPFPLGHSVEQGDFSLLDPVRARAPFWRGA